MENEQKDFPNKPEDDTWKYQDEIDRERVERQNRRYERNFDRETGIPKQGEI